MAYEGGKKQNFRKKRIKTELSGDIREIHMARNEGWSPVIPAKINGVQCQAVIDTAVQVIVVSEKIFQDLTPCPWVVEEVILKDATAINNIPAKVVKLLSFILGK